jgi:hypothetical protein
MSETNRPSSPMPEKQQHRTPGHTEPLDPQPIIDTASINADQLRPTLLACAASKGAIQNFTGGMPLI